MDQVSRPMQIALVAVVLLAGMWFTVLKPKPADDSVAATPAPATSQPVAPGVKGLTSAVDKAKAAAATSDATNAKIQKATGSSPAASSPAAAAAKPAKPATAKPSATKATPAAKHTTPTKAKATTTAAVKPGAKAATPAAAEAKAKATKPAAAVDPSNRLLAFLAKGKTLVILFHGAGADDKAARKAVHRTALADPKHVISAYVPIGDVGKYEAITTDVHIVTAPSILVIGTDGKATLLTGYVDAAVVAQTVGDARREAAKAKAGK